MKESFWIGLGISFILIFSGAGSLITGVEGSAWGYPVPLWGKAGFLIVGLIILIMLISHWRKEKKKQNFDHETKLGDSQDNSTTNASTDDSNDNSGSVNNFVLSSFRPSEILPYRGRTH